MQKSALLICFFVISFNLLGQYQRPVYQNLVLEGGGIWGIAYGGAFQVLEQQSVLQNIKRVGGTSAGAIQATMLAVGFTADEIINITNHTSIKKLNDGRFIFLGGTHRLFHQYGWYRGDALVKLIRKLVAQKTGNPDITFAQLHQMAEKSGFRDLYITGTNLTTQKLVIFSHETYPNLKIAEAVRISMSIPFYYKAVFMDDLGNVVSKPKKSQYLQVFADGGIIANYPINLFDQNKYLSQPDTKLSDSSYVFNNETLGLRLDRSEQIAYNTAGKGLAPYEIKNFKSYVVAFYNMINENLNRFHPEDNSRTIDINTLNYSQRVRKIPAK
jgi:NTE family protein